MAAVEFGAHDRPDGGVAGGTSWTKRTARGNAVRRAAGHPAVQNAERPGEGGIRHPSRLIAGVPVLSGCSMPGPHAVPLGCQCVSTPPRSRIRDRWHPTFTGPHEGPHGDNPIPWPRAGCAIPCVVLFEDSVQCPADRTERRRGFQPPRQLLGSPARGRRGVEPDPVGPGVRCCGCPSPPPIIPCRTARPASARRVI